MQNKTQSLQILGTWRLKPKSSLRVRLLGIFGHVLMMAILVLFLSVVQTVTAAPVNRAAACYGVWAYPDTQETDHASSER